MPICTIIYNVHVHVSLYIHTCTCTYVYIPVHIQLCIQDSTLRLLREESRVLSKSKFQVEQYLRSVKSHLQTLDTIRRALQTKISTLSQSLQLDAQSFKVYITYQHVFTLASCRFISTCTLADVQWKEGVWQCMCSSQNTE